MPIRKYICPKCKQEAGVSILYGMPGIELADQAERNEIVLGGCVLNENQSDRQCKSCGNEWQIERRGERRLPQLD
jgi:hypothetical protein